MNTQSAAAQHGNDGRDHEARTLATLCARANAVRRSSVIMNLGTHRDADRPTRRLMASSAR